MCCKWVGIERAVVDHCIDYMLVHGARIWNDNVYLPVRCQKLTEDNLCSIYPDRPKTCKDAPECPDEEEE